MQSANDNPKNESDDPAWLFLTECSLGEDRLGDDLEFGLSAGSLFQTIRELGLPLETQNQIEATIKGIARETMSHSSRGRPNLPVSISLFCHRKALKVIPHSEKHMQGGWGYFLIQRGMDFPITSFREYDRVIELYLYKEGD